MYTGLSSSVQTIIKKAPPFPVFSYAISLILLPNALYLLSPSAPTSVSLTIFPASIQLQSRPDAVPTAYGILETQDPSLCNPPSIRY